MNLLFAMLIDLAMAILLGVLSRALMEIIRQNIPLRVHPRRESRFSTLGVKEVLTICLEVRLFVGLLFWACFFLSACIFFIVRRNFLIQDGNAEIILRMKALVYAYYRSPLSPASCYNSTKKPTDPETPSVCGTWSYNNFRLPFGIFKNYESWRRMSLTHSKTAMRNSMSWST